MSVLQGLVRITGGVLAAAAALWLLPLIPNLLLTEPFQESAYDFSIGCRSTFAIFGIGLLATSVGLGLLAVLAFGFAPPWTRFVCLLLALAVVALVPSGAVLAHVVAAVFLSLPVLGGLPRGWDLRLVLRNGLLMVVAGLAIAWIGGVGTNCSLH